MKTKLLIFAFLLFSFNVFSQDWIKVTEDTFGNKYHIKSSIVSKGGEYGYEKSIIRIWTKETYKKMTDKTTSKEKVYHNPYMIVLMEYDCKNYKSRILSRTVYNSNGAVIFGNTINPNFSQWDYIVPDSVGEAMLEKVCELYN